jgi:ectoine hydroxylase-related dioxygenase (phytanoyl-CoA dioxygenase family)
MVTITQAQVETYREIGCVHIPGAFSAAWVETIRRGIETVVRRVESGEDIGAIKPNGLRPPAQVYRAGGALQMNGIVDLAPEFALWMRQSPACEIVAALTGAETLRFWIDGTFIKEGNDPVSATPWHNDECTYGFQGEQIPSLWMALTDVDEDNAPLVTLAGSNRDQFRYHSTFSAPELPDPPGFRPWSELLARVAAADADLRVWPAKAGDALLIHPRTIHSARARTATSAGRRMAFSTRWLGSDTYWNPNPLTLPIDGVKDPAIPRYAPPPEDLFPILWRRSA